MSGYGAKQEGRYHSTDGPENGMARGLSGL